MPPTFNLTGIVVRDMPRALAFYRLLGLDLPAAADNEPHVEVPLPGGLRLAFDTDATIESFDPSWDPGPTEAGGTPGSTSPSPRIGLAFACDSPAEVDKVHAELVAAGHRSHLAPWDAFWGQHYASVLDPDGNPVDLYAPLPPT